MFTNMDTSEYVKSLEKDNSSYLETNLVLMALFFDVELQIYHADGSGLNKISAFQKESKRRKVVKLYLNYNGMFDTIYEKSIIKTYGICQAILLDV